MLPRVGRPCRLCGHHADPHPPHGRPRGHLETLPPRFSGAEGWGHRGARSQPLMGPIEFHVVSFMDQGVIRGGRAADATVLDPRRGSSCCDAHPPGRGPRIRLRTNLEPRNTSAPSRAFRRLRQRELPPWRGRIHRDTGGERGEQRRDAVIQQYMSGLLLGPRHGRFPHLRLPREGLLRPDAHQLDAPTRGRAGFRVRLDANYGFRPPRDSVPLIPNPWSPAVHESVPCTVRGDDDFRLGRDLATEPRIHRPDRSGDLPPGRICKRHRDPHEHRARNDCDALRPTVLRAVPRPRRSAPCRIQLIEMVGCVQLLTDEILAPGQSRSETFLWNLRTDAGSPLALGSQYEVVPSFLWAYMDPYQRYVSRTDVATFTVAAFTG